MQSQSPPLLTQLAAYSSGISLSKVPKTVQRHASMNILDTIGCMASGARLDESLALLDAEARRAERQEASVLGSNLRLPIEAATRVNGFMGDVFELNDLIAGHASIATVPPSLALAEAMGAGARELIEAVIAGIEVVCRVHGAFYQHQKPFTETGMVQVAVASAIGAAAAASKLRRLSADKTQHAMAMAASLTSWCPAEAVFGAGNTLKPIFFGGWPGSIGLTAVAYAESGLTGPSPILESPIGYYSTVARSYDTEVFLDFDRWFLEKPRRKLHACCGYIHSAIDAFAKLRKENRLTGVSRLQVAVAPYIIHGVAKKGALPKTPNEARFNMEYCLAHAMVDSDVIEPNHSIDIHRHNCRREIIDAISMIEVVPEATYSHYRFVRIEAFDDKGRKVFTEYNDAPRGTEWNPMSDTEVVEKFIRLSSHLLTPAALDQYLSRFDALESSQKSDWLIGAFAPKTP